MGQWIGNEPIPNRTPPDLFAGNGVTNTFNLTYYPGTTDNIDVEVGGVPQRINSYSVNGKQLILAEAPPAPDAVTEGDFNIQVKYRGPVAQHTAIWENAPIAPNSGSANAILANYLPAIASLTANLLVYVILSASNTIAAPTFSPNGLPAKTVVDYDGNALKVGALKGTVLLRYDQTTGKWWVATAILIDNLPEGTTVEVSPPIGDNSNLVATTEFVYNTLMNPQSTMANITWDSSTDTYIKNTLSLTPITNTHKGIRRCLMLSNGSVNYYLDSNNSNYKADGNPSVLTGADGDVMVEIPKFYVKRTLVGTKHTWTISSLPASGFVVHPAFIKAGVEVPYRYISAYDACVNTTGSTYQSGLNYDSNIGAGLNWNIGTAKLASISGIFPAVGLKRSDARAMSINKGSGWHNLDFYLWSAIQLLYLIEFGTLRSQATTGLGNSDVTSGYPASSANQTDSPHSAAGKSNSSGNSTNWVNSNTRNTAWMSYRGIENLYGNCWTFVDGINFLLGTPYATNNYLNFADNTSSNYTLIGTQLPAGTGAYITDFQPDNYGFIPLTASGGSSTSYITDGMWSANASNTVLVVGGSADSDVSLAGIFAVSANGLSSDLNRSVGTRFSF